MAEIRENETETCAHRKLQYRGLGLQAGKKRITEKQSYLCMCVQEHFL